MQLHITRTHDGVSSVTFKDSPSSSSKDVRDLHRKQNIESIHHSDDDLGTTFVDDTYWESDEEDESPPIPVELLTGTRMTEMLASFIS